MTNKCAMLLYDVNNGKTEYKAYGNSILYFQLFCKSKTSLKMSIYKKQNKTKKTISFTTDKRTGSNTNFIN